MDRTPEQVGALVRRRREELGMTQEGVPGVSSSLVRNIERGVAPTGGQGVKRRALMLALRWPPNALDQLARGVDPDDLRDDPDPDPIHLAASGVDLEELRLADPEAYSAIEQMARIALDRARRRSDR